MNEVILKFTVPEAFHGVQAKYFLKKRCRISARLLASLKRTYLGISREGMLLKATDKIYAAAGRKQSNSDRNAAGHTL